MSFTDEAFELPLDDRMSATPELLEPDHGVAWEVEVEGDAVAGPPTRVTDEPCLYGQFASSNKQHSLVTPTTVE